MIIVKIKVIDTWVKIIAQIELFFFFVREYESVTSVC